MPRLVKIDAVIGLVFSHIILWPTRCITSEHLVAAGWLGGWWSWGLCTVPNRVGCFVVWDFMTAIWSQENLAY